MSACHPLDTDHEFNEEAEDDTAELLEQLTASSSEDSVHKSPQDAALADSDDAPPAAFEVERRGLTLSETPTDAVQSVLNNILRPAVARGTRKIETHRDTYYEQWLTHSAGRDPGIPDWSPTWNLKDFDIAHLRYAMRLSSYVVKKEGHVADAVGELRLYDDLSNAA